MRSTSRNALLIVCCVTAAVLFGADYPVAISADATNDGPGPAGECVSGSDFRTNTVLMVAPTTCIAQATPCVTVPFNIIRGDEAQMRAFSVRFTLSAQLQLCEGLASIVQGSYLTGETSFQLIDNGGGTYTVDCAILGLPCGVIAPSGTLFEIQVEAASDGTGTIGIDYVLLRDCGNEPISAAGGDPISITVDMTAPAPVTDASASQVKIGNDGDGTTRIVVDFTPSGDADAFEVYRAPYGSADGTNAYPEYDDMPGAGIPAIPSYPPSAPWALTGIVASGETDEPTERGVWYYVVFSVDLCGNAAASSLTVGTLNYHLGDVAPMETPDNLVETIDISGLGGCYGQPISYGDPRNILDVGPTTSHTTDGRPLTDNLIEFEDLVMFSLNYHAGIGFAGDSPPQVLLGGKGLGGIGLTLAPGSARVRAGQTFTVSILLRGQVEDVHAARTVLSYDPAVLSYEGSSVADPISQATHFFKDLPEQGSIDLGMALLGNDSAIEGEGAIFMARFSALANGDPALALSGTRIRDCENRELSGQGMLPPVAPALEQAPIDYRLGDARPNPFNPRTTILFDLPDAGAVRVQVFDVSGRVVRTLIDATRTAGAHSVEWDGTDDMGHPLTSGIYFYTMQAGDYRSQRRVTLLR